MKRVLGILLWLPLGCLAQQGVSIGANAPVASAMLEVKSVTKGFLPPGMSGAQRAAIASPAPGLMVSETGYRRLFLYTGTTWRYLLDQSYWQQSSESNRTYNLSDSIGIGNAAPTEKLHVSNGNLRVLSGNILMDNSDFLVNNPTGRLQFQSAGENSAFVQLSGNNLRFGTNVENSSGETRFMTGNTYRLWTDNGDLRMSASGKVTRPETGEYDLVPYCYGLVTADGAISSGTGNFQVEKYDNLGEIEYRIRVEGLSWSTGVTDAIIILTSRESFRRLASFGRYDPNAGYFRAKFWDLEDHSEAADFQFLIYRK